MKARIPTELRPSSSVLVIEDEPGDAQLIKCQLLERDTDAFKVHLADSLAAAQRLIDTQGLHPDVVLLDLNLPDSCGIATVERCRGLCEAPVVVLTGMDDRAAKQAAIQSGAEDYLTKGSDGTALRRAVRYAMLRHQRDADSRLAATVFAHAREGIMITSPDSRLVDVNATFTRLTGYSREEVIGRRPSFLKSGHQGPEFYAALWHDLTENGYWSGEIWNRRKSGEVYAEMLTISAVKDSRGRVRHYVGLFSDITTQKEHQRQLEHIAHYDALTGLPNRSLLADRMQQAMAQVQRRGQRLAVVYLDLDGFKAINDTHGHEAGDCLLTAVASRMKQTLREGDTLARLGGDEFVVVMIDLPNVEASAPLLNRLLAAAAQPVHVGGLMLQVSASLGVTYYLQDGDTDADQLLRQADQAMYQAKLSGKNRYHVFDADHDRSVRGRHESLERIRQALADGEFLLHYQPKVNMRSGAIIGVEALIRWQHPERGLLSPGVFLPVIEDHPLAIELGEWVIDTALTQMERWLDAGLDLSVSVNIGAYQLQQADFIERLRTLLAAHPAVGFGCLQLEVLESSALEDIEGASWVIHACGAIGVEFALDDFGTGYSSLTYLKRLPAGQLKIDQSFVRDMLDDPDDLAILEGVLGLAAAFRRKAIAEGVETEAQGEMLLRLGCELAQGYGIARPMPADQLPAWAATWQPPQAWAGRKPIRRDDLPLLFAGAEHRAWIGAVVACLENAQVAPPPLHPGECHFGRWLDKEGTVRFGNQRSFAAITTLHRQVHELANELLELQSRGRHRDAVEEVESLYRLRDELFGKVMSLLGES